ncbi:hypothetical protein CSUI_004426 [Cystoisospora suis]|uniref:Uncharacterized protein n=1 Tax=Cystoisospora suis TaxID=483139 RepID=A0A2C6L0Z1_9APIC|nr:hypothetical protein CSUI_004426 [Cystoisospora suis]
MQSLKIGSPVLFFPSCPPAMQRSRPSRENRQVRKSYTLSSFLELGGCFSSLRGFEGLLCRRTIWLFPLFPDD